MPREATSGNEIFYSHTNRTSSQGFSPLKALPFLWRKSWSENSCELGERRKVFIVQHLNSKSAGSLVGKAPIAASHHKIFLKVTQVFGWWRPEEQGNYPKPSVVWLKNSFSEITQLEQPWQPLQCPYHADKRLQLPIESHPMGCQFWVGTEPVPVHKQGSQGEFRATLIAQGRSEATHWI